MEAKSSGSLLKDKCHWCQKAFFLSELREHSSLCTENIFDESDDDATVLSDAMDGGPHSSNVSSQSALNVPVSTVPTTSSQQASQSTSQQPPFHEDSEIAIAQAADHASPESIQGNLLMNKVLLRNYRKDGKYK